MLTPTESLLNALLPLIIASLVMIGGTGRWRFLLPLGIALAVPAATWACFPRWFGQFAEAKHFLWLALAGPASVAVGLELIAAPIGRRFIQAPHANAGPPPNESSLRVPGLASGAWVVIASLLIIATGVAFALYRKTQTPGPTGWSLGTLAMHIGWVSLAGTAVAMLIALAARRDRSLAVPIVLALTSLMASAWLLFGAASFEPARIAGTFGWAVFGVIAASVIRRTSVVTPLLIACTVAGWCAIASFGSTFALKPDTMIVPITVGPVLLVAACVPFVGRMKSYVRTPLLVITGLLVGAIGLGASIKAYVDSQTEQPSKQTDPGNPYGGY
jgi:hypothetical protein